MALDRSKDFLSERRWAPPRLRPASAINNPHNQTLAVAVQWGILGVIVLDAMWFFHLTMFRGEGFAAWIGLLVAVQNFFMSLFDSHIFDFVEGWMYVLGVGIAGGIDNASKKRVRVETEGEEQDVAGPDIGLDLGVKQARPATPAEHHQLLASASERNRIGADVRKGFLFGAQSIRHATNPSRSVRIGEKISPQSLKKRFAEYEVRYAKGEDCLTCAVASGLDGQFQVSFAQDGRTIVDIRSYDSRSHDPQGNELERHSERPSDRLQPNVMPGWIRRARRRT